VSWITLTEADVLSKLAAPELAAMKSAALGVAQANPLPEVIAQIVREVRGYVAACDSNRLGTGATIPDELLGAAINRVRYELATRLPVASLLTDARKEANREATALLVRVSTCSFRLEQPAEVSGENLAAPPAPRIRPRPLTHRRRDADGI